MLEVLSLCLNKSGIIFHIFRWFVIYRRINAKVSALWRWPIMTRLSWLFSLWMVTPSAIEYCKWASRPTRQKLRKMSPLSKMSIETKCYQPRFMNTRHTLNWKFCIYIEAAFFGDFIMWNNLDHFHLETFLIFLNFLV